MTNTTSAARKGVEFELNGKKIKAYLFCKFGQYNCGVKTVGRLELKLEGNEGSSQYIPNIKNILEPHKDRIIAEFAEWLSQTSTHQPLSTGNQFFPWDTGIYPPGAIVYADQLGTIGTADDPSPWWSKFQHLIHELETHPKHGWVVVKSPVFTNYYYRGSGSHPSRIWVMFPPYARDTLAVDGNNPHKDAKKWATTYYPEDIADMLSPQALHDSAAQKAAS